MVFYSIEQVTNVKINNISIRNVIFKQDILNNHMNENNIQSDKTFTATCKNKLSIAFVLYLKQNTKIRFICVIQ